MSLAIVLALRLVVPLSIFRWPLAGAVASIAADTVDIIIFQLWGFPDFAGYHELDKPLDLYYLTIEAIVAQRWPGGLCLTATALYAWRFAGVLLFEALGDRVLLFAFPNLFENFFLFVLVVWRWFPSYELTRNRVAFWLAVLLAPKLVQEYVLHWTRVLDRYVAINLIADAWRAVTPW